jgi:hypothetical protein
MTNIEIFGTPIHIPKILKKKRGRPKKSPSSPSRDKMVKQSPKIK